jgi:hypothetical protein
MTPLNQLKAVEYAPESTLSVSVPQSASGMTSPFLGPRALRVGWRWLIFLGLLVVLFGGTNLVAHGGPQGLRNAKKHLCEVTITPLKMGVSEAIPWWLWFSVTATVRIAIQYSDLALCRKHPCDGLVPFCYVMTYEHSAKNVIR